MENTKLPSEFYNVIDTEIKQIEVIWKDLKKAISDDVMFKEVFNDIYNHSIVPYEENFIVRAKKINYLYRAVKSNEKYPNFAKYNDMIPKEGILNRWNPPGECYLYLSGSKAKRNRMYDKKINYCEKTCLEEIRAVKGSNVKISSCEFKIVSRYNNCKIFNLAYSDISLKKINLMAKRDYEKSVQLSINKAIKEIKKEKSVTDEVKRKIILREINSKISKRETKRICNIYAVKGILKIIIDQLFVPLDDNKQDKKVEYKPFHVLSKLLKNKGYIGILYKSTRNEKGDNVVFFDKDIAKPKNGTLKHYYY